MPKDDTAVVICLTQAELRRPVPDSRADRCSGCGVDVWISDRTLLFVHDTSPGLPVVIVCSRCGVEMIANDDESELVFPQRRPRA